MTHSKTPWLASGSDKSTVTWIHSSDNKRVCTMTKSELDWSNCERIASCVNACASLPDPEKDIPALIEALRHMVDSVERAGIDNVFFGEARAILSKVTV